MLKHTTLKNFTYILFTLTLILTTFTFTKLDAQAASFPNINVTFDPTDESVIVDGIPAYSSDGSVEYQLEGYLNYGKERCDTFCYAPHVRAYDEPAKMAYIFNWADAEFLLPCTGDYTFTAYVTARYIDSAGTPVEEKGPKTTIDITLHKKDESTNWGPGLPNTTVETYDLKQIKAKNKTITIEEPEYTWTIHGGDIETVPDANLSLKITVNPDTFANEGVDAFFGDTLLQRLNIEHSGDFGFKAILDYRVGTEYTGKYANLFYVAGNGTFEYIGGAMVDENGLASFTLTHASDYVLAITDVEYTGQELNPQVEEPKEDPVATEEITPTEAPLTEPTPKPQPESTATPTVEEASPTPMVNDASTDTDSSAAFNTATTSNVYIWIIAGIVLLITVILVILLFIKKKK